RDTGGWISLHRPARRKQWDGVLLDSQRRSGNGSSTLASSLSKTFSENRLSSGGALDARQLDEKLIRVVDRAAQTWPQLAVDAHQFVAALARRMIPDRPLEDWLASVHAADLYLCCGCANGDPAAIAAFEQTVLPQVVPAIASIDPSPTFVAEA